MISHNQLFNSVGPDFSIPIPSTAGQHRGGQRQGSQEHPALFGQNQINHGFGPIYAVPAFPWQHGPGQGQGQGSGQMQESGQWQNIHSQGQQHDDFGPVYAVPSFPWPHGHGQSMGSGQWQHVHGHGQNPGSGQWYPRGIHPQAIMPCCPCRPAGYRHYR